LRKILSTLLVAAILGSTPLAASAESQSLNIAGKRAKVVAKSALYGFGGGLVVGLATQVFKKKTRNIFICGSLGMYAGIALGIYVISTSRGPTPYEGPDTYEDYSEKKDLTLPNSDLLAQKGAEAFPKDALELKLLTLSF
jgi:hypothetical protein